MSELEKKENKKTCDHKRYEEKKDEIKERTKEYRERNKARIETFEYKKQQTARKRIHAVSLTYKELLKVLSGYEGSFDDKVVFVLHNPNGYEVDDKGRKVFAVTSVGESSGLCRLNNAYDIEK